MSDVTKPQPWIEDDRCHVWHPYTQMLTAPPAVPIERALGVYLHTTSGRKILDGISSWWVNIHGHSHPRLNQALTKQASRMSQVIFAGFTHEPGARLAAELSRRSPGRLPRVFFSDDGSTAVEVALKLVYQYWRNRGEPGRRLFVALDHSYHGDTFGAMAAGGVEVFHQNFRDLFFEVRRARLPFRSGSGEDLGAILERDGRKVAGMIIEPMLQGAGGMIVWPAPFLRQVRELCTQHGIPLIADEVLTGFGRTGRLFACEHGPIEPDLLCVSKALTAGYLPLAATLVTEEIYSSFLSEDRAKTFFHGHSYTGNALACAVALESLAIFDEERRMSRVQAIEALFAERLKVLGTLPFVMETRNIGGVAAIELAVDSHQGYLSGLGPRLNALFLDRGILLRPLGNVLYFMPPYVITDREVHWVFDEIESVLKTVFA